MELINLKTLFALLLIIHNFNKTLGGPEHNSDDDDDDENRQDKKRKIVKNHAQTANSRKLPREFDKSAAEKGASKNDDLAENTPLVEIQTLKNEMRKHKIIKDEKDQQGGKEVVDEEWLPSKKQKNRKISEILSSSSKSSNSREVQPINRNPNIKNVEKAKNNLNMVKEGQEEKPKEVNVKLEGVMDKEQYFEGEWSLMSGIPETLLDTPFIKQEEYYLLMDSSSSTEEEKLDKGSNDLEGEPSAQKGHWPPPSNNPKKDKGSGNIRELSLSRKSEQDEQQAEAGGALRKGDKCAAGVANDAGQQSRSIGASGTQQSAEAAVAGEPREYLVEKVLCHAFDNEQLFLLIKWNELSDKFNTWEPYENVSHIEKIKRYKKKLDKGLIELPKVICTHCGGSGNLDKNAIECSNCGWRVHLGCSGLKKMPAGGLRQKWKCQHCARAAKARAEAEEGQQRQENNSPVSLQKMGNETNAAENED